MARCPLEAVLLLVATGPVEENSVRKGKPSGALLPGGQDARYLGRRLEAEPALLFGVGLELANLTRPLSVTRRPLRRRIDREDPPPPVSTVPPPQAAGTGRRGPPRRLPTSTLIGTEARRAVGGGPSASG